MEFSRQEYWSWLLCPTPEDLSDPGIEPVSLALAGGFFTTETLGKPLILGISGYQCFLLFGRLHFCRWFPLLSRSFLVYIVLLDCLLLLPLLLASKPKNPQH